MPFLLLLLLLLAAPAHGQRTHVLVVSGISGEERFARQWAAWGTALVDGLERAGVARGDIVWLGETVGGGVRARATKEEIGRQVVRIAGVAAPTDQVLLVLFGHGSEGPDGARLNLPGPDLTARELAAMLSGLGERRVIIVNTASASGGFLGPLAGDHRVVVTATRSAAQNNETLFGGPFVTALAGTGADTDKDGRVSLLEAFTYARIEVARAYDATNRMQSEHALLDADGDGTGTVEPDAAAGDGRAASRIFFGAGGASAVAAEGAPAGASPELRALYERRAALQQQIDALRARRDRTAAAEYERSLEALLVDLATVTQAIRRLEGGGP